jgi:hypothetical protein
VALIERAGALDVYFENSIEILMPTKASPSPEVVQAVLTEAEVAFPGIRAGETR